MAPDAPLVSLLLSNALPIADLTTTLLISGGAILGLTLLGLLGWFLKSRQLTETSMQNLVHRLEEGGWAHWFKLGALIAGVIGMIFLWFFWVSGFKGLVHPRAFEQAEIAREIARGHGFSTKIIRPAEIALIQKNQGSFPVDRTPDLYHAPLWPTVLSPFVWMARSTWSMTQKDVVYTSDKIIAAVALAFFLLSVVVNYFLAKRLFDQRLAVMAVGLMLLCDRFWQFSMSGLPQMLMLFLFSCAAYALLRAVEAQCELQPAAMESDGEDEEEVSDEFAASSPAEEALLESPRSWAQSPLVWAGVSAVFFGLLALTHALTIWIFAGALLFSVIYFRQRGVILGVMLAIFLVLYTPWLVRTARAAGGWGNFGGVAWYSMLYQIRGTESSILRSMDPPLSGVTPMFFRNKVQAQTVGQFGSIYANLGYVLAAPVFFVALLHLFKRRSIAMFRWALLSMWLAAVFGMSVFGLEEGSLRANDLHVLFIPLLSCYGMAYLMVLWTRLEVRVRLLRIGFVTLIFLISALPFLITFLNLLSPSSRPVQWPPYVPPYIAILNSWTTEREIIMSDMPWAVAWYADREALWLPSTLKEYKDLSDYNLLKRPIVGLYLTPVSGNRAFMDEILKGEYKEWSPFIMRTVNLRNFPLQAVTKLPIDNECVFYADRDRWSARED